MKNKPVLIDSPSSKKAPKIFGNLCGTKPRSKTRDFDDYFEPGEKCSLLSNEILSKLCQYLQSNPLPFSPDPLKYALIEDLYIIWIKSKGISNTLSSRSDSSIKSRFYKRLRVLKNHDLKEIFNYIDENGIKDKHLVFTKHGGFQGIKDGDRIVLLDDGEEEKDNKENLKENQTNMEEEENFSENKGEKLEIEENEENSQNIYFEDKMEENLKENREETEENHEGIEEDHEEIEENHEEIEENPEEIEEKHEGREEDQEEIEENHEGIEENPEEIEESPKERIEENNRRNEEIYVETEQFRETPLNICCRTLSLLSGLNNTTKLPLIISKENDANPNEKFEKITIIKDFSSNNREFLAGVSSESIRVLLDLRTVFNRNIRIILQDLQKVSGNLEDLIEFYTDEENREHLLWNSEEDQLLEDLNTGKETSLKILIKYKGIERVKNRIKFKGLKKNFQL